jgi:hypothetical protein
LTLPLTGGILWCWGNLRAVGECRVSPDFFLFPQLPRFSPFLEAIIAVRWWPIGQPLVAA